MRKILIALLALGFTQTAKAETVAQCMGLGLPAAVADAVCGPLTISGTMTPDTDNSYDIGTSSAEFKDAYFDGTVQTDAITLDGNLTCTAATTNIIGGATAIAFKNAANNATNLNITDAGVVTVRAGLTVTAGGATVTAGDATLTDGNLIVTSAAKGLRLTSGTLAAAGSNQGDAAAVAGRVTTVTAGDNTKGIVLPATPVNGDLYLLINTANAVLKIYPGSGDQINALGANAAASFAAYTVAICVAVSDSQWWCAEPAAA